jgi:hypothetical protein
LNFLERTEPGRYFGSDLPIHKGTSRRQKKENKSWYQYVFLGGGGGRASAQREIKDWTLIIDYRLSKESINVNSRAHWRENSSLSDWGLEIRDKGIQIEYDSYKH